MSMVVQHNMQAMNSNRMLGITTSAQASSTEKLSSGYKINRAADDAAGLTISEKMRKQIRGLDRASTNAEDGVSAVQTAEGALTEVHSMLQRMNELAVQAANGTNSQSDREAIQDEIDQLTTEIDRVAETTKFNEIYLLKGDSTKDQKDVYMEVHDAGLEGTMEKNADGTYTFTMDGLEEGGTVTIAGVTYTIDTKAANEAAGTADGTEETEETTNTSAAQTEATVTDYTVTDASYEIASGLTVNGASTSTATTGTMSSNTSVTEDTTYTYDGTNSNWVNGNDSTTKTDAEMAALLGITSIGGARGGDTIKITAATVTHSGDIYAEGGDTALTDTQIIAADAAGDKLYTTAATPATDDEEETPDTTTATTSSSNVISLADAIDLVQNELLKANNIGTDEATPATVTAGSASTDSAADEDEDATASTSTLDEVKGYITGATGAVANDTIKVGSTTYTYDGTKWNNSSDTTDTKQYSLTDIADTVGAGDEVTVSVAADNSNSGTYTVASDEEGDEEPVASEGSFVITLGSAKAAATLHFNLHVGADADMTNKIGVDIDTMNSALLGIKGLDVVGKKDGENYNDGGIAATYAIDAIADAIAKVSEQRSALGAVQNRLEHTINNLDNVVENTTSAESRIRDTDMAEEMVEYSKNNILAQAGQAMLAQANTSTQGVLSLLG